MYEPAYIITHSGDSLSGLALYSGGNKLFKQCRFKENAYLEARLILPGDVRAYGFAEGDRFESKKIEKAGDSLMVFAECLLKGKVSLYKYKGTFFAESREGKLVKLEKVEKEVKRHEITYLQRDPQYLTQLWKLMEDCELIVNELSIQNVKMGPRLNEKGLLRLFMMYHECMERPYMVYKTNKPWLTIRPGLRGGLTLGRLYFPKFVRSIANDPLTNTQFGSSVALFPGVSMQFGYPRLTKFFSTELELRYLPMSFYSRYTRDVLKGIENQDLFIDYSAISLSFGLRYDFLKSRISPYLSGGLSYALLPYKQINIWLITETLGNEVYMQRQPVYFDLRDEQWGVWAGGGITRDVWGRFTVDWAVRAGVTTGFKGVIDNELGLRYHTYLFSSVLGIYYK
ncbi:MAG: hypothetical protein D6730_17805 [Bacteroidetes bacterium]|nr:MAG: hypothetical protein D6730_17805 [Bacteroidota bacterium]